MERTTKTIDGEIAELEGKIQQWQSQEKSNQERIATLQAQRDAARSLAMRHDDSAAKAELKKNNKSLAEAKLDSEDITAEIGAATNEISELREQKAEAAKVESWSEFLRVAAEVETESVAIDRTVTEFFTHLKPHAERLRKLNDLLNRADVNVKSFSLETFRRHLDERFRTAFVAEYFTKVGRIFHKGNPYEQSYSTIIEQRIANIKARHDTGAVVDAPIEEQTAVNE